MLNSTRGNMQQIVQGASNCNGMSKMDCLYSANGPQLTSL